MTKHTPFCPPDAGPVERCPTCEAFGPKWGTWRVESATDPRWNASGRAKGLVTEGGPAEMRDWIAACRERYGKPPADATMAFWKD